MNDDPVYGAVILATVAGLGVIAWRTIHTGNQRNRHFWQTLAAHYHLSLKHHHRLFSQPGFPHWLAPISPLIEAKLPHFLTPTRLFSIPGYEASGRLNDLPLRFTYFELHFWTRGWVLPYGGTLNHPWLYAGRLELPGVIPSDQVITDTYTLIADGKALYLFYSVQPDPATCFEPFTTYLQR
jgi:hypothetical protein